MPQTGFTVFAFAPYSVYRLYGKESASNTTCRGGIVGRPLDEQEVGVRRHDSASSRGRKTDS
jgi:hypothetical protein